MAEDAPLAYPRGLYEFAIVCNAWAVVIAF